MPQRDSPFANRLFSVLVRAEGVGAHLLVDSGATRTIVASESAAARAIDVRAVAGDRTEGVGGTVQNTRRVNGVRVERGGMPVVLDVTIAGGTHDCGPDGLLGMDALRGCISVLGETEMRLVCDAARER